MIAFTIDGGSNMVGKNIGLQVLLRKKLADYIFLHYMIQMNVLVIGILSDQFSNILNRVASIINKI